MGAEARGFRRGNTSGAVELSQIFKSGKRHRSYFRRRPHPRGFLLPRMDSPPIACKVATFPPRGKMRTTRCDLHIHSAASLGNDEWYTRLFGWPESYAEPARQYDLCKARGMSLVTLTDHDTIDGGLTLIDRPDFFLSEEVTTRFPENGCVMHVLAWNITPDQHDEIQARRNDIYRLCEYLNGAAIAHGLAHPLISPNAASTRRPSRRSC